MAWTAPKTWLGASEVITAALLNVHVRDNLLFLGERDPGNPTVDWWVPSVWTNGWTNSTGTYVTGIRFRKIGRWVIIDGRMSGGTAAAAAFTLPAIYRPAFSRQFQVVCGAGMGRMRVDATGAVIVDQIVGGSVSNVAASVIYAL